MLHNIILDLRAVERSPLLTVLGNRGFHALFVYRIAHWLWQRRIPALPLLLSRTIHIFYAIEIDYRARIEGGVNILHGFGTVIGPAVIKRGTVIFHGVTIGRNGSKRRPDGDPVIEEDVFLGAGAKILGRIVVGQGAKIGANVVVDRSVAAGETITQRKLMQQMVREAFHLNNYTSDTSCDDQAECPGSFPTG